MEVKKCNKFSKKPLGPNYYVLGPRFGFTLVELIVATGLFLTIVALSTGNLVQTLRTQRQVAGLVSAQSNIGLVLEQMAREVRTGFDFCRGANGCGNAHELVFTNAAGEKVSYRLAGTSIERGVGGAFQAITSSNVAIQYLDFTLRGNQANDGWPPRVTIAVGVATKEVSTAGAVVRLQTTISARTPDS